ncbi:amidase [Candidatus Omnitrophota bacterium]
MKKSPDNQVDAGRLTMNRRRFSGFCALAGLAGTLFPEALTTAARDADEITVDMIAAAEKIAGLSFSAPERESMVERLNKLQKTSAYLRSFELDNSAAPAVVFNPVLPGMTFSPEQKPFKLNPVDVTMPSNIEKLAYYPVTHLARLIEMRKVSSSDLTRMYLKRLKKYDPVLHCVVTLTEELALKQAKNADDEIAAGNYKGTLHGIPWGVKDLFAVRGYRTTWGAEFYRERIIDIDAAIVSRLRGAGAVLLAKLTTGAFARGEKWFGGFTRNPWNTEEGSSGSSAGPGAATSAGLVGFSVGSETRGSIAGPCERCGVSGLRPTYGRVSRYGAMTLSWSMDKVGPICRTAEDCAVVFNAMHGKDGRDNSVVDLPFNWDSSFDVDGLRVGYVEAEFSGSLESIGDRAKINKTHNDAVLDVLRSLGVELVPIELPHYLDDMVYLILFTEAVAAFDFTNPGMNEMDYNNFFSGYHFVSAVDYIQANRVRLRAMEEMEKAMGGIDAYVTPTFVGPTNIITNITGHPEVIVPSGFNDKGTPVSISFVGKLFGEEKILALAHNFQKTTDFHLKYPEKKLEEAKES